MLLRQKQLLYILRCAGGSATRRQVVKWSFLIAREASNGKAHALYHFVPYRHGPFSFLLYHEMQNLVMSGYVAEMGRWTWSLLCEDEDAWRLPIGLAGAVEKVVSLWKDVPLGKLEQQICSSYEWYASMHFGKCQRLRRPGLVVYTVGYEGLDIDAFLNCLLLNGVERVIDVRYHPVSRKWGFSRAKLADLCGRFDIEYVHMPSLGVSTQERKAIATGDQLKKVLAAYACKLWSRGRARLEEVASLVCEKTAALLCFEADPAKCHRAPLAAAVSSLTGIQVIHLCGRHAKEMGAR